MPFGTYSERQYRAGGTHDRQLVNDWFKPGEIKKLSDQAGLAPTTTLRWVEYLVEQQLVTRDTHPTDLRTVVVKLTEVAERTLISYFSETLTALA